MPTIQKVLMAVIGVAMVTTFLLPDRQTGTFFSGISKLTTGTISTAQGTSKGAVG